MRRYRSSSWRSRATNTVPRGWWRQLGHAELAGRVAAVWPWASRVRIWRSRAESFEPPFFSLDPSPDAAGVDFIPAVAKLEDKLVLLLDIDRVFDGVEVAAA